MTRWMLIVVGLAVAMSPGARSTEPSTSLYQLEAKLTSQDGLAVGLDLHRGHPVLVTMFYAGCQATCPVIIDTLRAVEHTLTADQRRDLRVLLISIDPEHDTPAALAALARERRIDLTRWTLARADERTVRQIAAAVGQQYRRLPSGQYSHSTQISVLSPQGEIIAQSAKLGTPALKLVVALTGS
jgi:protein SCO1/2